MPKDVIIDDSFAVLNEAFVAALSQTQEEPKKEPVEKK